MYVYDDFDHAFVSQRVAEFRDQVARRLSGELSEDQFRPLRLMNGVYLQLHAYMLRIAIPYGELSSRQMRMLAHIARTYDKGYGHFTTRQNIQFNWPALSDIPAILEDLAKVEMHAVQTSGNCIRNVTSDAFAGVAGDEYEDPRPWAEAIRQWSTIHPEFSYLPRKFKIAISGAVHDRAAVQFHDIGIEIIPNPAQPDILGFRLYVGGGMGRTPREGRILSDFIEKERLFGYLDAILRVYNRYGRRDNKYKARIKILVDELGLEAFRNEVEAERVAMQGHYDLPLSEIQRIAAFFPLPAYEDRPADIKGQGEAAFDLWLNTNVTAHRHPSYAIVSISLKPFGGIPGDADAAQMDALADLADRYSFGEIRVTHRQNLVLPHVRKDALHDLWQNLKEIGFEAANIARISDIICCPGLDYCSLANARSIPIAQDLSERFADPTLQEAIGSISLNISGCINACGHHHVGNIGILGVDKRGDEAYQLVLGGSADETASIGELTGPGFSAEGIVDAVETVVRHYLAIRHEGEKFIDTYRRIGLKSFKEALYGAR